MAEAAAGLASLGVAANILQLVNLVGKVAAQGYRVYRDPDRQIEDVFDLSTLANLTSELRSHLDELGPNALENNAGMGRVARDCAKFADQLLGRLDRLDELGRSGKKRDAIKAAAMSLWKQDEIKALGQRLEQFKSEFAIQLLLSIRSFVGQPSIPAQQEDGFELCQAQSTAATLHETIKDPSTTTPGLLILDQVSSKVPPSESDVLLFELRPYILDAITTNEGDVSSIYQSSGNTPSGSFASSNKSVLTNLQDRVLEALKRDVMNDRQSQISTAHTMTFRWIFMPPSANNPPQSSFSEWLRDATASLYWVTGKPGSGKSTLMKFILTYEGDTRSQYDTEVEAILRGAEGAPLWTTVSYYAWHAGQKLQKSIDGLCRSLIYQLAKGHPEVLPTLLPSCWEALWLVNGLYFKLMERVTSFLAGQRESLLDMVREVTKTHRIFFLIDGLDEIDDDTENTTELILDLASLPNVKVCTSSRPWPVFEDAFGRKPNLTMQDLTKSDIRSFVKDKLHQSNGFKRLQKQHPGYASGLIDQVAQKSAGVFLWVALVAKSLQRGLREDERIVDLQRRIDELPSDLNELFTRIIESFDDKQLKRAREYFGLLALHQRHYPENDLTAFALSFADEDCPGFAIDMPLEPLTDDEVDMRVDTMSRRVESVSRGLLEVVKSTSGRKSKVDYLHRIVVEFLRSSTAHRALSMRKEPSKTADLDIQLLSAYLCLLKDLKAEEVSQWKLPNEGFQMFILRILAFASHADKKLSRDDARNAHVVEILHQADLVGAKLAIFAATIPTSELFSRTAGHKAIRVTFQSGHWALDDGNLQIESMIAPGSMSQNHRSGRTFLSMVVRAGICSYVRDRQRSLVQRLDAGLDKHGQVKHSIWPLLADVFAATYISSRMIRQLLEIGADPDHLFYLPRIRENTTPLRMAILSAGDQIVAGAGSFRTMEEMREVLTEMASASKKKNLSKKDEAQLNSILKATDKFNGAGR